MARKILGIIWAIIAVALLALLMAFLCGRGEGRWRGLFRAFRLTAARSPEGLSGGISDEAVLSSEVRKVEARLSSVSLEIRGIDGGEARVNFYNGAEKYVNASLSSGVLDIRETGSFSFFSSHAPKVTVQLPCSAVNEISVEKSSGSLEIQGFELEKLSIKSSSGRTEISDTNARNAEIKSSSGSVQLSDSAFGTLTAKSSSGSIRGNGISARTAKIDTTSGSVRISGAEFDAVVSTGTSGLLDLDGKIGQADITHSSGAIEFRDRIPLSAESRFETSSGAIRLTLVPSGEYFFDTKVSSGKVTNDLDSNRGGSVPVHARANSGSIRIKSGE